MSSEDVTALAQLRLAELRERAPHTAALLQSTPGLATEAAAVLDGSDFAFATLLRDDGQLEALLNDDSLHQPCEAGDFHARVAASVDAAAGEAACMRALRLLRRREMLRLAWRDLAGTASLHQTLRETSWFADAAIAAATRIAALLLAPRHGHPPAEAGELVVLGMGKLGGSELNFSSDVDLVFLYPGGEGETDGPVPLAVEEYYTRQSRLLIRLLDAGTEDGFVFRVDMRLRPFGDSGPLAASFTFFEDYLSAHGRDWERYAYVKARAITGIALFEPVRQQVLRPFVYRRYLDFGVFEALREMKGLIARDVQRRDRAASLKLGVGGIREIEFIVQAFQLVRGGQDSHLREPSLLTVLPRLGGAKLLPAEAVQELQAAYDLLRKLENLVQMFADQQTHELPGDPLVLERISRAAGFADAAAMQAELAAQRGRVALHFAALFREAGATPDVELDLAPLWEPGLAHGPLREQLRRCCGDGEALLAQLAELVGGSRLRRLDETGRRRLKTLLELLLGDAGAAREPDTLKRVFSVIEAIGQRSAYFSLLVENRGARTELLEVCRRGDFLAGQLARNPALLDELLDERWKVALPDIEALAGELRQRLADVPADDVEREVEALARFKQAAVFRVALADLSGRLPLMRVSDRLTDIAVLILEHTMVLALQQMSTQLGAPYCTDSGGRRAVRIAALGYGKLGGFELGYGSDLDLVFLHDSSGEQQETDAANPVDNQVFFLRYAQRLIHLLTMHSSAGRLYEVDVRLRPSGKGGMLVTSIEAFRRYQFEEAWTWEHQALLHARAVAGDASLRERIEAVRTEVLRDAVRRDDLHAKVAEMRERMRRELSSAKAGQVDLKQDRGGIADIEFLAQYWALEHAAGYPPVVHFPDTIRQLESLASAALVPQHTVDVLVRAYQLYRVAVHRNSLEGRGSVVPAGEFAAEREAVAAIWRATMGESV
ncbi:MAG: bifunctional [glutamate--ammonia ligase]-adenylyl-L-tyrosine phosphorylase/[glutamate--ammonia-ligase] adenylyltransferase [Pseudomonadota bacterium]|nr:bifunctional [glutamate--ammonia ligase]-adenylyl-L-tyrosine phosphorylase/[glutamate--ammonia-ligase] adenylyltransferase [Pseudomonadota bacterium]